MKIIMNNRDALIWASGKGRLDDVKRLLNIEGMYGESFIEAFKAAIKNNCVKVIDYFMSQKNFPEVAEKGNNLLLAVASIEGNLKLVKALLTIDAVRNNVDADNNKALWWALQSNKLEIVRELLKIEAVRNKAKSSNREMFIAVAAGPDKHKFEMIKLLASFQEFDDLIASRFHQALISLIDFEKKEAVQFLLGVEKVRNTVEVYDNRVLKRVIKQGWLDTVQDLLKIDTVKNNVNAGIFAEAVMDDQTEIAKELLKIEKVKQEVMQDDSIFSVICQAGNLELLKIRLELESQKGFFRRAFDYIVSFVEYNGVLKNNNEAFREAACYGHLEIVRELLKIEAVRDNAHANNNDALRMAVQLGNLEVVQELLKIEVVRNYAHAVNGDALRMTVRYGHVKVIQELLKIEAVKNTAHTNYNELLRNAAQLGHLDIVLELLKIESVRNNAHALTNYALRCAAANGHLDIVLELLKIEVVRNSAHVENNDALRGAAENGHLEIVQELLKIENVSENVHALNNLALRLAAENGHLEIVRELLKIAAVRNAAHTDNNYALRKAAAKGQLKIVRELLKIEAVRNNAHAENNEALRVAANNGHPKVVQELIKIQAVQDAEVESGNAALKRAISNGGFEVIKVLTEIKEIRENANMYKDDKLCIDSLEGSVRGEVRYWLWNNTNVAEGLDEQIYKRIEKSVIPIQSVSFGPMIKNKAFKKAIEGSLYAMKYFSRCILEHPVVNSFKLGLAGVLKEKGYKSEKRPIPIELMDYIFQIYVDNVDNEKHREEVKALALKLPLDLTPSFTKEQYAEANKVFEEEHKSVQSKHCDHSSFYI